MKRSLNGLKGAMLLSIMLLLAGVTGSRAQDVTVSYQSFYDNLAPYGQWVSDPQYGNVWVPNEGGDFRPYGTRGHWVMTDYGNTWVSDDPWGWACYHYGRWTYDPYYGWVWIPGYEWAPAWVTWRYGGGYCGWAPLGPGITMGMAYNCPSNWWVFVGPEYMYRPDCMHYWRGESYNTTYIQQTTIINNYYVDNHTSVKYNYGPRADVIERDTHTPVQVYRVSQSNRPGEASTSGNRIAMYRPEVNRNTANTARPANVIQAPHQIGRPQAVSNGGGSSPAPFHQQMQRGNMNSGGVREPQNQGRPQQGPQRNEPAPQHYNSEPQHNEPAPQSGEPTPAPQRSQPAPQPQQSPRNNRFGGNPGGQQPRPQPPMNRPMSQPAPQPMPQQRQQPAPRPQQAPQPRPQLRPAPQQQRPEPREEGGGRR